MLHVLLPLPCILAALSSPPAPPCLYTNLTQYEPTIKELRQKYESVSKEKMLVRLERDRLSARVVELDRATAELSLTATKACARRTTLFLGLPLTRPAVAGHEHSATPPAPASRTEPAVPAPLLSCVAKKTE
jgi:hypothetical protein